MDLNSVEDVRCDETVVITEPNGRVTKQPEEFLQKTLQWLLCAYYMSRLPLQHLLLHLQSLHWQPQEING